MRIHKGLAAPYLEFGAASPMLNSMIYACGNFYFSFLLKCD